MSVFLENVFNVLYEYRKIALNNFFNKKLCFYLSFNSLFESPILEVSTDTVISIVSFVINVRKRASRNAIRNIRWCDDTCFRKILTFHPGSDYCEVCAARDFLEGAAPIR